MFTRDFKPTATATRRRFFATDDGGRTQRDERVLPVKLITATETGDPTQGDLVAIIDSEGFATNCLLGELSDIQEALAECLSQPGKRLSRGVVGRG